MASTGWLPGAPSYNWSGLPGAIQNSGRYIEMKQRSLLVAASLAALLVSGVADAAGKQTMKLYRYKNAQGQLMIESSIPPEYATKGYQIITPSGQVLEDIPPSQAPSLSVDEERAKAQREAELQRQDVNLRKLYSAPQDAERQRDRQIDGIKQKQDFAKGQLSQLTSKRKAELEQAAAMERKGKPVPPETKASIERLNKQIAEQEQQVRSYDADMQRLREEFDPVIERLRVIYPNKAAPAAAPTTPAATPVQGR